MNIPSTLVLLRFFNQRKHRCRVASWLHSLSKCPGFEPRSDLKVHFFLIDPSPSLQPRLPVRHHPTALLPTGESFVVVYCRLSGIPI